MQTINRTIFNVIVLWAILCSVMAGRSVAEESSDALSSTHIVSADTRSIAIQNGQSFLLESGESLSPDAVATEPQNWQSITSSTFTRPVTEFPVWLRFTLVSQNTAGINWVLNIPWPFLQNIEIYVRDITYDRWIQQDYAIKNWHIPDLAPSQLPYSIPIRILPDRQLEVFLRVRSMEKLIVPMTLFQADELSRWLQNNNLFAGLCIGALLVMLGYNLSLLIFVKDRIFAHCFFYVALAVFYQLNMSGIGKAYIWYDNIVSNTYFMSLSSDIGLLSVMLFVRVFLSLPKIGGWVLQLSNLVIVSWLCVTPFDIFLRINSLERLVDILGFITCLAVLVISVWLSWQGNQSAKYITIAWSGTLVASLMLMLSLNGVLPYDIRLNHLQSLSFVFEMMLLSIASAERINTERAERLTAQAGMLEVERQAKTELSCKVEERTTELRQALRALEEANQELAKQSQTDSLTQLANRRHFDRVLQEEFRRATRSRQPIALILCDIDHFKTINDRYGHPAGDECLRQIARILECSGGRAEDLAARYGGEEFVIILPGMAEDTAFHIAERIRQAVENIDARFGDDCIRFTASFGVSSMVPTLNNPPDQLVNLADQALYLAKHNGRNRVEILQAVDT